MSKSTMTTPLSGDHIASILSGEIAADPDLLATLASADTGTLKAMIAELRAMPRPARLEEVYGPAQLSEFPAELPRDSASAQAYWWGWELFLPEKVMNQVKGVGQTASGIFSLLASAAAAGLIAAPLAPLLGAVAASIALRWGVMVLVDTGNGIKLASPWVSPLILVPLPIDA